MSAREYPAEFTPLSAIAYAMLEAVGRTNGNDAWQISQNLGVFYDTLTEKPDATYTSSGRIRVERDFDGDEFHGLRVSVEVGYIWADNLPADFVRLTKRAKKKS